MATPAEPASSAFACDNLVGPEYVVQKRSKFRLRCCTSLLSSTWALKKFRLNGL